MRNPHGYTIEFGLEGTSKERDTVMCGHCNAHFFVKPFADPSAAGGFCRMCMKHTCVPCAAADKCEPFEKKLEAMERNDRMLQSILTG